MDRPSAPPTVRKLGEQANLTRADETVAVSACLAQLEASIAETEPALEPLVAFPPETLDAALRQLIEARGAESLPLLTALAERASGKHSRKAAKRALYRLAQSGIVPPPASPRPVVERRPERAVRAWTSGIDGSGSRVLWILFEGGSGGFSLCSVIVNDQAGIMEVAGGAISKKRLGAELDGLRKNQKLPWVEIPAPNALGLVAHALRLHEAAGSHPPAKFSRWRSLFDTNAVRTPLIAGVLDPDEIREDPSLLDRSASLLDLPELGGWFVDPGLVHSDAVELLQARESPIVVSDQIKAEREAGIVDRVADREFTGDSRQRWAERLIEMAGIFAATGRPGEARAAYAAALALQDGEKPARHLPFVRALVQRGLDLASEVALGRLSADEISRDPHRRPRQ